QHAGGGDALQEAQRAVAGVAEEDAQVAGRIAGDVDELVIGADGNAARLPQRCDGAAVSQGAGQSPQVVGAPGGDGVAVLAGRVQVLAIVAIGQAVNLGPARRGVDVGDAGERAVSGVAAELVNEIAQVGPDHHAAAVGADGYPFKLGAGVGIVRPE